MSPAFLRLRLSAYAELGLARILSAIGRKAEATSEARIALELYEGKGDRPGATETQALLDELDLNT